MAIKRKEATVKRKETRPKRTEVTGRLARSEVIQVRFDKKLRKKMILAAAKERRTLSSFIERAIEQAVKEIPVTHVTVQGHRHDITADEVVNDTWHIEEADFFIRLALKYPDVLSFDEQRLWDLLRKDLPRLQRQLLIQQKMEEGYEQDEIDMEEIRQQVAAIMHGKAEPVIDARLRRHWERAQQVIGGELDEDELRIDVPY